MDNTVSVLQSGSIREIIGQMNRLGITRENVVSLLQDSRTDEFVLVYYK